MDNNRVSDHGAHSQCWLVLGLVSIGTFMSTLDVSIVMAALPSLRIELRTSDLTSQWFALAYTLVVTILLLPLGKLGDICGRRRMYEWGIISFVLSSILCGFSMTAIMLIAARAIQAIGSAIMMAAGPAMVTEAFPDNQRGKAMGFIGMSVAMGLCAGPVVGGLILKYASWRWMFYINVPIGLVLTMLLMTKIRGFDSRRDGKLDLTGAALMALALAAVTLALTQHHHLGKIGAISLFTLGVILTAAFVIVEKRVANPILDLKLFNNRTFSLGCITGWANYAAIMPVSLLIPFYLKYVLGYAPDRLGLTLAFGPLTLVVVAPVAGSLSDRFGSRALTTVGLVLLTVGLLSIRTLTPTSTWFDVIWRLVLASFGSAVFTSPNSSSIMGSVKRQDLGVASGTVALVRNLGMVSGMAIAGAIIASVSPQFTLEGLKAAMLASAVFSAVGAALSTLKAGAG
ncbi:MAG: MFS transporter [Armatimonadetes bacterium]|nr:MFS transporter [Armatimonadota bacterium]